MSFSTETKNTICPICGHDVKQPPTGRKKEYCSTTFQEFNKFLDAAETRLLKINFKEGYSNKTKSRFFRTANLIKIVKKIKDKFGHVYDSKKCIVENKTT